MKKIIIIIVPLIFFGLLLTVYSLNGDPKAEEKAKPLKKVFTKPVESVDYQAKIFGVGKLGSKEEIKLSFKTGGIIQQIHVREGQRVRKGQLLATLNMEEIDARTQQAQTGLQQAEVTRDNAQLALNIAERDYRNAMGLYKDSVATLEQLENAELQLNSAKNQLEAAKIALNYSKQNVNIAAFNQTHSLIKAPANGIVLKKFSEANELVGPGTPVLILSSQDVSQVVRVNLTDKDVVHVQLGDKATIEFDAYPGGVFNGKVIEMASIADPFTNTFEVEISVKTAGKRLLSGFIGKVHIQTRTKHQLLRIPFDAMVSGDEQNAEVFVIEDKKAKRKTVNVFKMENTSLLIENSGVELGDQVVVKGGGYLKENDSVVVNN